MRYQYSVMQGLNAKLARYFPVALHLEFIGIHMKPNYCSI